MNKKTALIFIFTCFSLTAHAFQNYSPEQLQKMVKSGNYPAQGKVTRQVKNTSFSACVSIAGNMVKTMSIQYPTEVIVNTKIMYMAKMWTNDAAMTLTCSSPDKRLVITTAKYL